MWGLITIACAKSNGPRTSSARYCSQPWKHQSIFGSAISSPRDPPHDCLGAYGHCTRERGPPATAHSRDQDRVHTELVHELEYRIRVVDHRRERMRPKAHGVQLPHKDEE
jgi:hypothetical protein